MIVYPARDIRPFVMYCVNGKPRSSLLIESTDSMIIISKTSIIMLATSQHLNNLYPFAILSLCNRAPLFLENFVQTLLEDRRFGPPSPLAVAGR